MQHPLPLFPSCFFVIMRSILLWAGPGCSSLSGAMEELGPFRVNKDGQTLWLNEYAWNHGKHFMGILISNNLNCLSIAFCFFMCVYRFCIFNNLV